MSNVHFDQAEGLRRLLDRSRLRVIAVAAGCTGLGCTTVTVNLAAALAVRGERVLIIDENYGPLNVAGLLGMRPHGDLLQVIEGVCPIEDALLETGWGVAVLPAASGVRALARLGHHQQEDLIAAFGSIGERFDVVLIDTPSGTVNGSTSFSRVARDMIIVSAVAELAITTAYTLLKQSQHQHAACRYHILLNRVADPDTGQRVFSNLQQAARTRLRLPLDDLGCIPKDECCVAATRMFQSVVTAFPQTASAVAYRTSAETITNWPVGHEFKAGLDTFMQRLFMSAPYTLSNAGA